jgi:uncharacterized membrane protein YhaH (DUF805 family)
MTSRPDEPGYVPAVAYEEVSEYEPYPVAPADLPAQVPYAPDYPHQTVATVPDGQPTLPQATRTLVGQLGRFDGRLPRSTFWLGVLGVLGAFTLVATLATVALVTTGALFGASAAGIGAALAGGLLMLGGFGALLTVVGGGVRRLHDTGLPGWLLALWCVPFGWIGVVVLLSRPSEPRRNRYGPDPAAR